MNTQIQVEQATPTLGHNSASQQISITLKLFNRAYQKFGDGQLSRSLEIPAGTTIGDVLDNMGIPDSEVFIAFVNGRDVTNTQGQVSRNKALDEGDALAISGPVPYSWGYGAPVV